MGREMELLKHAIATKSNYSKILQLDQQQAMTDQEQSQGMRGDNQNTAMTFPGSSGNFTTQGMDFNLDISKFDSSGNLVKSYENTPPGIQNLSMGEGEGTVIETPSQYQRGGFSDKHKSLYSDEQKKEEWDIHRSMDAMQRLILHSKERLDEGFYDKEYNIKRNRTYESDTERAIKELEKKKKELSKKGYSEWVYHASRPTPNFKYKGDAFKLGDGLTAEELDDRVRYDWYDQNRNKRNFGYKNLEDFRADYPEAISSKNWPNPGDTHWSMDTEAWAAHSISFTEPQKFIKIKPKNLNLLPTDNSSPEPIKALPYDLVKNESDYFTIERVGTGTHTYPKGDDNKALIRLKDTAGRVIFKGSQTEYMEKYGDYLTEGTTKHGEKKKGRLYLQKGGFTKYQTKGFSILREEQDQHIRDIDISNIDFNILYNAIEKHEHRGAIDEEDYDSFIRTKAKGSGSSAYGPIQLTRNKLLDLTTPGKRA